MAGGQRPDANQAFRIGRAIYAMQFHFEADTNLVRAWNRDFVPEIAAIDPDWAEHHAAAAPTLGSEADRVGGAIARAWIATIGGQGIVNLRANG